METSKIDQETWKEEGWGLTASPFLIEIITSPIIERKVLIMVNFYKFVVNMNEFKSMNVVSKIITLILEPFAYILGSLRLKIDQLRNYFWEG